MKLIRYASPCRLYDHAAARFARLAEEAIQERGRFLVLLSGGSTPRPLYQRLADSPWRTSIDWEKLLVGWSDERCVPPDHPDSNFRTARDALLSHVPIPPERVFRIRGEDDPGAESASYAARLEAAFGPGIPPDLVLLGLGADGHTASLFPGDPALDVKDRLFASVHRPTQAPPWRVTATVPLLTASREILFLVTGKEKATALAAVRHGDDLPAARITPTSGRIVWMADEAACAQ